MKKVIFNFPKKYQRLSDVKSIHLTSLNEHILKKQFENQVIRNFINDLYPLKIANDSFAKIFRKIEREIKLFLKENHTVNLDEFLNYLFSIFDKDTLIAEKTLIEHLYYIALVVNLPEAHKSKTPIEFALAIEKSKPTEGYPHK